MTAILIQSRMGSTRLPGKALLPLGDCSVLRQVIRRCARSNADRVVVVSKDKPILDVAFFEGVDVSCLQSDKRDVVAEYYHAAAGMDTIVRITGDCPCVSPKEIDQMIGFFKDSNCDYMFNHSDYAMDMGIDGLDIEVFSFTALKEAYHQAKDREHVCTWMLDNLKSQRVMYNWDFNAKLSIDIQEDYERVFKIYEKLGNDFETINLQEYFKDKENEEEN